MQELPGIRDGGADPAAAYKCAGRAAKRLPDRGLRHGAGDRAGATAHPGAGPDESQDGWRACGMCGASNEAAAVNGPRIATRRDAGVARDLDGDVRARVRVDPVARIRRARVIPPRPAVENP
jgi:hypothetical protein